MIVILDFGSQYTQLIARRVREANVFCEIHPFNYPVDKIRASNPRGLILSGGPASVFSKGAPHPDPGIFALGLPVLGICYGLQVMVTHFGGQVVRSARREYGPARIDVAAGRDLFAGLSKTLNVWMSHGDAAQRLPEGFVSLATTANAPFAACADPARRFYGVQFHPEVHHTPQGREILSNFLFRVCGETPDWDMASFAESEKRKIRETVGSERVILALSGGVDSSVTAALLREAIGTQLICIFVNNGLLRQGEEERVRAVFGKTRGLTLEIVDARRQFLSRLRNVTDPERKRKIIGHEFISVFERSARKYRGIRYLAQGTLYPDVIESVSVKGPSATIKTHHNVGGLPKRMKMRLLEPLRFLFKDEVRELGRRLGLPADLLLRQPFPGPGLAIRVLGAVTEERLDCVRKADHIVEQEIRAAGLYNSLWQAFAVLLPVNSVGVMGDERTYEDTIAVRAVRSVDAMTADWARLPEDVLAKISSRIVNEVRGVNRVVYDITSKPPATIEWE
ncbi:MAG TPA: glutamine-hydrolyzing GMP synthase [Elusimicrobiota bacterium]|nr:glutamine-hydrolyzing GMP synthase [Elusimicrobiota bacterium]